MDTDWCIVCDARVYPEASPSTSVCFVDPYDETTKAGANPPIQVTSSAFCSTSCLLKAYDEAEARLHSGFHLQSLKIQPKTLRSTPSRPPCKSSGYSHHRHLLPTGLNRTSQKTAKRDKKIISQFTFGSYASSSSSSPLSSASTSSC